MPEFAYKAVRRDGSNAEGRLEARDRTDAARRLSMKGLQVFQLDVASALAVAKAAGSSANGKGKGLRKGKETAASEPPVAKARKLPWSKPASKEEEGGKVPSGPVRLRPNQVIRFTEELSDLLGAGVPLEPALKMMEGRGEVSAVRQAATLVRDQVRDGKNFSRALQLASPSFGDLYCNLVAAGEASGALPSILRRQVTYLTTLQELKGRVVTALIYPAFLFVSGFAVTMMFVLYLIPRLSMLIESTGAQMPLVARFAIAASGFVGQYWWALLSGIVIVLTCVVMFIRAPGNQLWWGRVQLRLPLYGSLLSSRFHVQFLETLGNMVSNGLTLMKSLELCVGSTPNPFLQEQIGIVAEEVADGSPLYRALERRGVFPPGLIDMLRIGEQTGKLEESLIKAGERYDRDLNKRIERISAMVQPVIILVMATVVGFMAYMMITLIYDTITILRTR